MPTYNVLSPINAGDGIQRDGTVKLTEAQAAPLIAQGVLSVADTEAKALPKKAAKAE